MFKRKQYIVDKDFQSRFIARVLLFIICSVILSGIVSYVIAVQIEKSSRVQLYGATNEFNDDIETVTRMDVVRPIIIKSAVIGGLISILVAGLAMYFYSNRLAGPVYHLNNHLRKIIDGNYGEPLVFRKKDEFSGLADTINELQEKIKKNL